MSQVPVKIMQQDYVLSCPDGQEAALQEAVAKANQAMQPLCETAKVRTREQAAVLVAVNFAFQNLALQKTHLATGATSGPAGAGGHRSRTTAKHHTGQGRSGAHPGPVRAHRHRPWQDDRTARVPASPITPVRSPDKAADSRPGSAGRCKIAPVCNSVGLYIALNQCSLSTGLVHCPASVIVSRQMNPMLGCPRPPEPPVQVDGPVVLQTPPRL